MSIIDLDSHLRDGWFLDEIYQFEQPFAQYTPKRIGNGQFHQSQFEHQLGPDRNENAARAFRTPRSHSIFYDPANSVTYGGGEIWQWQQGGYDMEARLKDNAREGLDVQFLFPTAIGIPTETPGSVGIAAAQNYNNWVGKLVAGYEDRLFPIAMLPARNPEGMAPELHRCVTELGFKAAHMASYTAEKTMDDPAFDPFYQMAQDLNVPLFCHPSTGGELTDRGSNFGTIHVLGRPLNCVMALTSLVMGGVFERFPDLKVAFFECTAEFLVYWMHRMDDEWLFVKDDGLAPQISTWPSEYVRNNCYVTCEADEKMLPMALQEVGETHVVMATDYPHFDSTYPHTVSGIRGRDDLTERQKKLILEDNALGIVNL